MIHVPADTLRSLVTNIYIALGTPDDIAHLVADTLVEANLAGHDSHGVMRTPQYIAMIEKGNIQPAARPVVVDRRGARAIVDGGWGWGPPAAFLAAQTAADLARDKGVGAVTARRTNHIGRVGAYAQAIARDGQIGFILANVGAAVTPFGGRQRLMGTNPIAWAVPRAAGHEPLVLDFATSVLAEGKVRVAKDKGVPVPPGVILDSHGQPSQNPNDFYDGGMLLPFGGYKGYGVSVMIELLGGALSGSGVSPSPKYGGGNGTLVLALNIADFVDPAEFEADVEDYVARLKAAPTVDDVAEVLLPGEPEQIARRQREVEGIPLPEVTWEDLQAQARRLGVG